MSFTDLVIQNDPIITMDPRRGIVNAAAVLKGKLIAVGNKPEVKRLIEPMTEIVDLDEQVCTPGLVNIHDHFLEHGISYTFVVDIRCPKKRSIKEIVQLVEERVKESQKGQ